MSKISRQYFKSMPWKAIVGALVTLSVSVIKTPRQSHLGERGFVSGSRFRCTVIIVGGAGGGESRQQGLQRKQLVRSHPLARSRAW